MHFGHFHFFELNYLSTKGLISRLPTINIPNHVCETCELRKMHKETFSIRRSYGARKLLEVVHSKLCTVDVPSHGSSKYFITFIDDFNKKTWVYFLKHKSKTCDTFKSFKAFVEKESGCKIKALKIDRG